MAKDKETLDLILRVFKVFNGFEGPGSDTIGWRTDGEYAPVSLYVNCNDLFYWASADAEDLTLDNIHILEKAVADMKAVSPDGSYYIADILFCCRVRKMRPQKPYYKYIDERFKTLFDECGPERDE